MSAHVSLLSRALLLGLVWFPAQEPEPPQIAYTIRPRTLDERAVLDVTLDLVGDADGETHLILPRCRFGTPDVHLAIRELWVDVSGGVAVAGEGRERVLTHAPSSPLRLRYQLSWDPGTATHSAYRPEVGPALFHFFGEQWRVRVEGREAEQRYVFAYRDVPEGWQVFSGLGPGSGPWRITAKDEDVAPLMAGGDYATRTIRLEGTPVGIAVGGGFEDRQGLLDDVARTAELLARFFGAFPPDTYVISITGRGEYRAGVAIDGAYVCLADPSMSRPDLLKLIAHETFHVWLPGAGTIREWQLDGLDEYRFDWFVEGFSEYCARRLLLDSGLITPGQYVEFFNDDLRELARNPMRGATLAEVQRALEEGAYTNRHERLSYLRGPLLALVWDEAGDEALIEVVRDFVREAGREGGAVDGERFFGLLEDRGIPARRDYRRHVVEGLEIVPPDLFEGEFVRNAFSVETYEPGFDPEASRASGVVTGVISGSSADLAGLRDGMVFVRFETKHSHRSHATVFIQENGSEREIEYTPVHWRQAWRFEPRQ